MNLNRPLHRPRQRRRQQSRRDAGATNVNGAQLKLGARVERPCFTMTVLDSLRWDVASTGWGKRQWLVMSG